MKKTAIAIAVSILVLISVQSVHAKCIRRYVKHRYYGQQLYWKDYVTEVEFFSDKTVTAIAAVNDCLYVAAEIHFQINNRNDYKTKFYIMNLKNNTITDVSSKVTDNPHWNINDDNIKIDETTKTIYLIQVQGQNDFFGSFDYAINRTEKLAKFRKKAEEYIEDDEEIMSLMLKGSIPVILADHELNQYFLGVFRGNIYQLFRDKSTYRMIYKTSSEYNWPISGELTKDLVFFSTRGDGMVVVNRKNGKWKRYLDRDSSEEIRAFATYKDKIYIGGKGLDVCYIDKFKSKDQPWNSPRHIIPVRTWYKDQ